jgi:hypothetical protein
VIEVVLVETNGIRNVLKCAVSEVTKKLNGICVTGLSGQRIHSQEGGSYRLRFL